MCARLAARPGPPCFCICTSSFRDSCTAVVRGGEQHIGGAWCSLEPPGPLLMHLHTVYMECSECPPTLLNPLAES
jgi:hypothetical protein